MNIYRRIYEDYHGTIPVDCEGRTYEIHHLDGDRTNNDISNLKAVSIQEHYDIHHEQNDWAACLAISMRMNKSPEEISKMQSEIGRKSALKRKANGTNPFCQKGSKHPRYGKKHTEEAKEKIRQKRSEQVISEETYRKAALTRTGQKRTMETKSNISLGQKRYQAANICVCPHCDKQGPKPIMTRWHFDNCKDKS